MFRKIGRACSHATGFLSASRPGGCALISVTNDQGRQGSSVAVPSFFSTGTIVPLSNRHHERKRCLSCLGVFFCSTAPQAFFRPDRGSRRRRAQRLSRPAVAPPSRHAPPLPGRAFTASSTAADWMVTGRKSGTALGNADVPIDNRRPCLRPYQAGGCARQTKVQPYGEPGIVASSTLLCGAVAIVVVVVRARDRNPNGPRPAASCRRRATNERAGGARARGDAAAR